MRVERFLTAIAAGKNLAYGTIRRSARLVPLITLLWPVRCNMHAMVKLNEIPVPLTQLLVAFSWWLYFTPLCFNIIASAIAVKLIHGLGGRPRLLTNLPAAFWGKSKMHEGPGRREGGSEEV